MTLDQRYGLLMLILAYPALLHLWHFEDINTIKTAVVMLIFMGITVCGMIKLLNNK